MSDRLRNVRLPLLELHKALLEAERRAYEHEHRRVSAGELFELVVGHEQFAWLRSLSELIVQIDEALDAEDPPTPEDTARLLGAVRALLTPSEEGDTFQRKYFFALQREPDVVLAHAAVMRGLGDRTPPS